MEIKFTIKVPKADEERVCKALSRSFGEPPVDEDDVQMSWPAWIKAHMYDYFDSRNDRGSRHAASEPASVERESFSPVESPVQILRRISAAKDAKRQAKADARKAEREEARRLQHEEAEEAHRIAEEARLIRVEEEKEARRLAEENDS